MMAEKRFKLALFDCDGTLVDSQHMIVASMEAAFRGVGLDPPERSAITRIVGLSLPDAIRVLARPFANAPVEKLLQGYREAFFTLRSQPDHHEPLYEGARAALDALAAREDVLIGMATGKSRRGVEAVLDGADLRAHFITTQSADDAPSKPHPAMVRQACAEAGVSPRDTVVIGDTTFDMAMAMAAGAHALGVGWGYHEEKELRQAGAERVIGRFADLVPALDALWQ